MNYSNNTQKKTHEYKMVFNIIFAILLMVIYAPSFSNGLAVLQLLEINETIPVIIGFIVCIFAIITGCFLIKRHKLGFIFQYIINSLGLLCWGGILLIAISLFITNGGNIEESLAATLSLPFMIMSLPPTILHSTGLIYYTKNKKKYFEKRN